MEIKQTTGTAEQALELILSLPKNEVINLMYLLRERPPGLRDGKGSPATLLFKLTGGEFIDVIHKMERGSSDRPHHGCRQRTLQQDSGTCSRLHYRETIVGGSEKSEGKSRPKRPRKQKELFVMPTNK